MASKPNSAVIASRISDAVDQAALINGLIRALEAKSQALMDECWEFTKAAAPTEDLARTLFESVRAIEEHRSQDEVSQEARDRFRDLLAGDPVLNECLGVSAAPLSSSGPKQEAAEPQRDQSTDVSPSAQVGVRAEERRATRRMALPQDDPAQAPRRALPNFVAEPGKNVAPAITAADVGAVKNSQLRGHEIEDRVFEDFIKTGRSGVYDVAGISPYLARDGGAGFVFEIAVYSFRNGSPDPFEESSGVKKWRKKLSAVVYERLSKLVGGQPSLPTTPPSEVQASASERVEPPQVSDEARAFETGSATAPSPTVATAQADAPPAAEPGETSATAQVRRPPAGPRTFMRVPQAEGRATASSSIPPDTSSTNDVVSRDTPVQPPVARQDERVALPAARFAPSFRAPSMSRDVAPPSPAVPKLRDPVVDDTSFGDEEGLPAGEAVPIELIAAQAASRLGSTRPAARGKPPPDPFD